MRIGIIGAGPGGICMTIKLRDAGFDDITVLEKAPGVGGVWWHNRYPGAACDVQSYLYSYSFEPKHDWSRPFAQQPEIQQYLDGVVDKYGIRDLIHFDTEVARAVWGDDTSRWSVTTTDAETFEFDALVSAIGMFNELHWPDIDGLDGFTGTMFHSARWPKDHDLRGERVAVIGSAASAVQFVPEIAPQVAQLNLYQRTANWVLPKADDPFTDEELEALRTDPEVSDARRQEIYDRVESGLTFEDPEKRELSRNMGVGNIAVVEDPVVREKLTPTHPFGCKRPLISNDYFPTFNRENVELITDPIERVTEKGVVTADGVERVVDTLIIATGFETTRYLSALDVTGRDGTHISEAWSDGAIAYLGVTTAGFPNLFMLYGPNTNNGSIIYMIEQQVGYSVRLLEWMRDNHAKQIDVRPDAMADYNDALQDRMSNIEVWNASCNNYYHGPSGRVVTQWPSTMTDYRDRCGRLDIDAYETS